MKQYLALAACILVYCTAQSQVTSGTISGTQTICSGGDPAAFTETAAATGTSLTYQWQSSPNGSTGWTNISAATAITYDVPSGLSATTYYRRQVNGTGTPSSAVSNVVTVTINSVTGGSIGNSQTVCSGGSPATFTQTSTPSGSGALTYQWQKSTGSFADIAGATSSSFTETSSTYTNTQYRRYTISTLNGVQCSAVSGATLTVSVNSGGAIGGSVSVCSGSAPVSAFSNQLNASGTVSGYQWQSSTDNVNYTNISGATATTYQASAVTQTTYYRRQSQGTFGGVNCTNYAGPAIVTVIQQNPGTIGNDQTVCSGGDPAIFQESASASGATQAYQWQKATTNSNAFFGDIAGATNLTYDPPSNLTTTTYYRRKFTSTQSGQTCSVYSNVVTAYVNWVSAGTLSGNLAVCTGGTPATLTESSGAQGATLTYQWLSSTDNVTFTPVSGATGISYNPPSGATQTIYYKRTAISTLNGVACNSISSAVSVILNTVTGGTINGSQLSCYGGVPTTFGNVTGGTGNALVYKWQKSTDNVNFTDIPGSNANLGIYSSATTPQTVVYTTTYFRRLAIATLNTVSCNAPSNVVIVTLNEPGVIGNDQAVCVGSAPLPFTVISAATGSSLTYQWQQSTTGTTFADISGATSSTYQGPALTTPMYYRRIAKSILPNGNPCTAYSNVISVVLNLVSPGIVENDRTVCSGGDPAAFSVVNPPSGSGSLSYQWQTSFDATNYTNISGATSATYDVPAGISRTSYFKRVVTSTLMGNSCNASNRVLVVSVNTAGIIAGDVTICAGIAPPSFASLVATSGTTTSYQWQRSIDNVSYSNISGATQATYSAGPGILQSTYFRRLGSGTLNGVSCTVTSNSILVTVLQVTAGSISGNETTCAGVVPSPVNNVVAASGGSISYLWQKSTDGVNYSSINGATGPSYTIPAALSATTSYRRTVTGTSNGATCTASSNVVTKTLNWTSGGTIGNNQGVCINNVPLPFTEVAPAQGQAITYSWLRSVDGSNFIPINGANSSGYTEPNALSSNAYYKRQAVSSINGVNCTSFSNVVSVSMNQVTAGTINGDYGICPGGLTQAFGSSQLGSGPSIWYDWQSSTDGVNFTNVNGHFATYMPPSGTVFQKTYYRRLATTTLLNSTCSAVSNVATLYINDVSGGVIGSSQIIANGAVPAPFTEITPATGGTLSYQWQYSIGSSTFTGVAGATGVTYSRATGLTTSTNYRRMVTSVKFGITCTAYSNVITVSVPARTQFISYNSRRQEKAITPVPNTEYTIYPNPVVNRSFSVVFASHLPGKYSFNLIDGSGGSVYRKISDVSFESTIGFVLPLYLASGLYRLEILTPEKTKVTKAIFIR